MKSLFSAFVAPVETELRTVYRTEENAGGQTVRRKIRFFRPDYKFVRNDTESELIVSALNVHIKDNHILKDVNLTIPEKKITCIIGPSGCGKTTLLKTLNRLTDSVEGVKITGKIFINGEDIINSGSEITRIRRKMGLISQRPCPLPMSIFDNVAYGCRIHGIRNRRKLRMIVKHYLDAAGLWDEVKDRLRTPAVRLSIGQQQRLCLARSLAVEPQFILADEATSALDPISSKIIEELFVKLKQNYSIVMVTHTLRQALRIADHVVFMYLGEIIETGSADYVFNNPQHELTKKYLSGAFS
ncbi:MAG: phosphate ABC transporter ATP-binding protein [Bacteroidales bacterium]|jgi:phosphate transport system ATP-binding protein|nr:phosphate ABC transporter ATP-binding protein [Bacteroidales bacterium]